MAKWFDKGIREENGARNERMEIDTMSFVDINK
jgi:hypothetical protein